MHMTDMEQISGLLPIGTKRILLSFEKTLEGLVEGPNTKSYTVGTEDNPITLFSWINRPVKRQFLTQTMNLCRRGSSVLIR
jgi:hypothetical protein